MCKVFSTFSASNFYPRSPCGERHQSRGSVSMPRYHFYPRSPCGERRHRWIECRHPLNFYPRSPCGERPGAKSHDPGKVLFLSTLSLRRATMTRTLLWRRQKLFLSTLSLRRATRVFGGQGQLFGFLSTLSLRRATRIYC